MPKRPTQRERILAMLRQAGSRGVHSNEFLNVNMPRFAARIHELVRDGHPVYSRREGNGKRYWYRPAVVRMDMDPELVYRRGLDDSGKVASLPAPEDRLFPLPTSMP